MSHTARSLLAVILGVFLVDFLFWNEKMGINCLIFSTFYVLVLAILFPENRLSRPFLWTSGGSILTAVMVTFHNSGAAKIALIVSAISAAGFAQSAGLRFILMAFLHYLNNLTQVPTNLINSIRGDQSEKAGSKPKNWRRWLSLSLVPLLIVSVFYLIYYWANEKFATLSDLFWTRIGRLLAFDISFWHLSFLVVAIFLVGAAFWRGYHHHLEKNKFASDIMIRQRSKYAPSRIGRSLRVGLGREYRQSVLLLGLLNLLLLVVNFTDIVYVWFGFDQNVVADLKKYVHEGTYFLIGSIVLAMVVLFQIFRKNLNFYPKNGLLKQLSLVWLLQNAVLAWSVGVRNWRYIDHMALAYKRIGVCLFLILVMVGLITLWLKIRDRRSLSWLWQRNSWAFYALLVANALVPWDTFITNFNLAKNVKTGIDANFLIYEISDKNLRILEQNKAFLLKNTSETSVSTDQLDSAIVQKRRNFELNQSELSWKSWNFADASNK